MLSDKTLASQPQIANRRPFHHVSPSQSRTLVEPSPEPWTFAQCGPSEDEAVSHQRPKSLTSYNNSCGFLGASGMHQRLIDGSRRKDPEGHLCPSGVLYLYRGEARFTDWTMKKSRLSKRCGPARYYVVRTLYIPYFDWYATV